MALPRRFRLSRKKDIDAVFKQSKTVRTAYFVLKIKSNTLGHPRAAVSISVKVSPAATGRNLIRRRVSAVIQELLAILEPVDILVIVQKSIDTSDYSKIRSDLTNALRPFSMKSINETGSND